MADAQVTDLEEFKASKMRPFRLGTLELDGQRIRLLADCSLTAGAAKTLAAQLLALAESLSPKA